MMKQITIFKNFTQVIGSRTLPEILKAIQQGVYQKEVLAVRRAVQRGDQKVADETKKSLHAFTVSGRFEDGRTMERLAEYHPFVILDIDKLKEDDLERVSKAVLGLPYTHACFLSPSGNGCKIIVKVNSNQSQHLAGYLQVSEFYERKLNIKIDKSGKDITRLCFFSFDEKLFYHPESKIFQVKETMVKSLPFLSEGRFEKPKNVVSLPKQSQSKIESCLIFTKKKSQYMKGNRNNFVYLFASNCNREGISKNEVLSFAKHEFDLEENEILKTIQSAYHHHTNEHGGNQTKRQSKRYQQLDAQESFYSNLTQTLRKVREWS